MTSEGRVPPHDLGAESAVLSAMLLAPDCIDEVREVCDENAFYSDSNRQIFRAVLVLHKEGEPVDLVRVVSRLKADGRLEQVGGSAYIVKITQATPAIANVTTHAKTIQDLGRIRRSISELNKFSALAYGNLDDPKNGYDDRERVQRFFGDVLETLTDIAYERQTNNLRPLSDVMLEVQALVTAATQTPGSVTGVPTCFAKLDRMLTGLHEGDVTIVASRPGMGKTAFAISMARKIASKGYAVPIFSLEMPAIQLAMRLLSQESGVDLNELRSGRFDQKHWPKITQAMSTLSSLPLYIDDTPGITILDVRGRTRLLQRMILANKCPGCTQGKLGVVIIDYLQLLASINRRKNREEEVSQTSQQTKRIAKELGVPLMALSQLNREPEKRKDHRPELSDLRESGSLEQDADNVIFIFRPGYYQPDEPDLSRLAEIIVAKQRNGPTGTVKTAFVPETARFENLSDDLDPGVYDPRDSLEDDYGIQDDF
jgi:replicative DNA helicase